MADNNSLVKFSSPFASATLTDWAIGIGEPIQLCPFFWESDDRQEVNVFFTGWSPCLDFLSVLWPLKSAPIIINMH